MLPHPPCPLTVVRLDSEELLLASSGVAVVIHLYYCFTLKSIEVVSVLAFSWLSLLESTVVFFLCHIIRSVHAMVPLAVVRLASVMAPTVWAVASSNFVFGVQISVEHTGCSLWHCSMTSRCFTSSFIGTGCVFAHSCGLGGACTCLMGACGGPEIIFLTNHVAARHPS